MGWAGKLGYGANVEAESRDALVGHLADKGSKEIVLSKEVGTRSREGRAPYPSGQPEHVFTHREMEIAELFYS